MSSVHIAPARTLLVRTLLMAVALGTLLIPISRHSSVWPHGIRAQPALLAWSAQHPHQQVQVIIQKRTSDGAVASLIARLGGSIIQDLRIINAVAARLPASAIATLARDRHVRWVSLDAPTITTTDKSYDVDKKDDPDEIDNADSNCTRCINTTNLRNAYVRAVGASEVWNTSPYLQGQGIGVAVLDSGIADPKYVPSVRDFSNGTRIVASVKMNSATVAGNDKYGHGTHVAGIIGGDGYNSSNAYIGIAPKVNLINVKVSNDQGEGTASDVVRGLQWILDNKATYNIRVVNISLNSAVAESYHTSPINAAVEILWFNGIVVVVSAGNEGKNALYPPANDPFVITVGATDDQGTASISDDVVAKYSGSGTTVDGFVKPDLVAPGSNIVSTSTGDGSVLAKSYPSHLVAYNDRTTYFRMSGTSMAAPVVSGAIALLLQDEPHLTPDQVKYRLKATAKNNDSAIKWSGYNHKAGAGLLDIPAAIQGATTESANTGIAASRLLWSGSDPITWNSVNWNSVNWNSVNWNSVNWNSVNWNSDVFE